MEGEDKFMIWFKIHKEKEKSKSKSSYIYFSSAIGVDFTLSKRLVPNIWGVQFIYEYDRTPVGN